MYYPEELIEEVRTRNDIVEVISGYVRLQKKGSNYFGLCPFHNEKSPSFSVSPGKQMYYCFGCGAGGNVITFLMEYENQTFPEAVRTLAQRAGIALPEADDSKEARQADSREIFLLPAAHRTGQCRDGISAQKRIKRRDDESFRAGLCEQIQQRPDSVSEIKGLFRRPDPGCRTLQRG